MMVHRALLAIAFFVVCMLALGGHAPAEAGSWTDHSLDNSYCGSGGCQSLGDSCRSAVLAWYPGSSETVIDQKLLSCERTGSDRGQARVQAICCGAVYYADSYLHCDAGEELDTDGSRLGCVPSRQSIRSAKYQYQDTCDKEDPSDRQCGNPISLAEGNKVEVVVDFTTPGPDALSFVRYYSSHSEAMVTRFTQPLGIKWQSNFDRYIHNTSSTVKTLYRPDGTVIRFTLVGGVWTPPVDVAGVKLEEVTNQRWEFTDIDDTVEYYGSNYRLLAIYRPNGYTQILDYDTSGRLASVTDSYDRTLTFTFTGKRLTSMTAADGKVYSYSYDKALTSDQLYPDRLIKVTYPKADPGDPGPNPAITYHYEDADFPGYLTGITDEKGVRYATWAYDDDGRAITSKHAGDVDETTIVYNTDGSRLVTNPLGQETRYVYGTVQNFKKLTDIERQASASVPAATTSYTYDTNGYMASRTDFEGNVTNYVHDSRGLQTSRTEAFGASEARSITTAWHADFNKPTQIVEPGRTIDLTYDDDGLLIERSETDTTSHSVPYSTNGQTRIWSFTYDEPEPVEPPPVIPEEPLTMVNPDAETGDMTGWTTEAGSWYISGGADHVFHAGSVSFAVAYQDVAIPLEHQAAVDAGSWDAKLTWMQWNWNGTERGSVMFVFLDALGQPTGPSLRSAITAPSTWTEREHRAHVPPLTRTIRVKMIANRTSGSSNDTHFDDFALTLVGVDPSRLPLSVQNSGAETVDTTGWTAETGNFAIRSANPSALEGTYYFYGAQSENAIMYQDLPIPLDQEEAVDLGSRGIEIKWYQASYTNRDKGRVILQFLDATGTSVGADFASPLIAASTQWEERELIVGIPINTRTIRLKLNADKFFGANNDAYFDYVRANLVLEPVVDVPIPLHRKLLAIDGPRTDVTDETSFDYDEDGYLIKVTNALGHETEILSYDTAGRPLTIEDANDTVMALAYDGRGRLTSYTVEDSVGGDAVTAFTYDAAGQIAAIELPDGSSLLYEYDDAHRLTAVENDLGERIEYSLDDMGNVTQEDVRDAGTTIVRTQSRVFDSLGRLIESIGAATQSTAYAYDDNGKLVSLIDGMNNETQQAFDALNRLITVTDPDLNASGYAYDGQDNLTDVTDERGLVTSYVYNGFGEVIQETSPDSGTTVYLRDAAGNVTERTDARSVVTEYDYDALNRRTATTYPASAAEDVTYGYDDTTGGNKGVGRLTSIADQSGTSSLVYDLRGNLIEETRTLGTQSYTTAYAYDLADRVTEMVYPSGRIVTYTRDALGRVTAVTTQEDELATPVTVADSITYAPFGPIEGLDHGNGLSQSRPLDLDYRLSAIATTDGLTPIQDLAFGYDAADGITSITDNLVAARSQSFDYDALRRLTDATGAYGDVDYGYDAVGNRTSRVTDDGVVTVTDTYSYDSASNRLLSVTDGSTTRSFTYNAAGAVIADDKGTGTVLDYGANAENRLVSVEDGLTTLASYTHNAQGERVIKTAGSATTHYHYDQAGRLIAESDGTGAVTREHITLAGLPLALVDHGGSSPVLTHVHADHLGTPQKMTDGSKAVVWDLVQTPFGETYSLTATAANDNRLPGQRLEADAGLHYNYFRDYDPDLGRYLQSDPIGLEGGLNTYAYVGANPVNYTDSLGLDQDGVRRYKIPIYRPPLARPDYEESVRKVCIEIQKAFDRLFNESAEDAAREQRCEENLERDLSTCRALGRRDGKAAYTICEQQAMLRYSNCLSGRDEDIEAPLPPFN